MTTASLHATSLVAGTVGTSANVLGAPNGTWTTDVDNTNWDARFAMGDIPAGQVLDGTQTIGVLVRKETGTGTPNFAVELWENGVSIASLFSGGITSTTGVTVGGNFNASAITNPNDVEIRLIGTGVGGAGSVRTTPQVDAITWTATYIDAPAEPSEGSATVSHGWSVSAGGEAPTVPANEGTSTVAHSWTISASGEAPVGDPPNEGTATVAYGWVASAVGETVHHGIGAGGHVWVASASGEAPTVGVNDGTATITYAWMLSTAGEAIHQGTATTSHAWTGSAVGEAPVEGQNDGVASVPYSWVTVAAGGRSSIGSVSITHGWTTTAVGDAPSVDEQSGVATAPHIWSGSASGVSDPQGTATAFHEWVVTAGSLLSPPTRPAPHVSTPIPYSKDELL